MTFKEWKLWYNEKNWTSKWFIVLILIRPIVDKFYWLKDISPLLSPLYIVGVLTPVLVLGSITSNKMESAEKSDLDPIMRFLFILVTVNCLILIASNPSIEMIGNSIKYDLLFILYFYVKRVIRSYRDLLGVLRTFLYSCVFPLGLLLYENIFSPISNVVYLTEGRGGGSRISGGYADIMTYAVFIVIAFVCVSHTFLRNIYFKLNKQGNLRNMAIAFGLCLLGLISIKQVSTWAVFIVLVGSLISFNVRNSKAIIFILFIGALSFSFFKDTVYDENINPLIQKEINVANGDNEVEAGFNGRVGRWERYYDIWIEMPFYSILFGVSTSGNDIAPTMVGGGMHNDFLRFTFLAGVIGLVTYGIFLLGVFRKRKKFRPPEKYLILCSVICIVMHSVSTLPTLYATYIYFLVTVFCYSLLPKNRIYLNEPGKSKKDTKQDSKKQSPQRPQLQS